MEQTLETTELDRQNPGLQTTVMAVEVSDAHMSRTDRKRKLMMILYLMKQKWSNEQEILQNQTKLQYLFAKRRRLTQFYLRNRKVKQSQPNLDLIWMQSQPVMQSQPSIWSQPKCGTWWDEIVPDMSACVWKENFRMKKETFETLCQKLKPYCKMKDTNRRWFEPLEKRLAMCIYTLSSSTELCTVAHLFGVGKSTVHRAVLELCQIIVDRLMSEFIRFPSTREEFLELTNGFLFDWQFPQAFAALGGCHFQVSPPAEFVIDYSNYMHSDSVVLLAACDFEYQFLYIHVGTPGQNNVADVFSRSCLPNLISNNGHIRDLQMRIVDADIQPLMLGNSAFPLMPNLTKPYPEGLKMTNQQRLFNYHLSCARHVIEVALGRLKARFKILRKSLEYDIDNVSNIVLACCILSNVCDVYCDQCEEEWLDGVIDSESHPSIVGENNTSGSEAHRIRDNLCVYFSTLH